MLVFRDPRVVRQKFYLNFSSVSTATSPLLNYRLASYCCCVMVETILGRFRFIILHGTYRFCLIKLAHYH